MKSCPGPTAFSYKGHRVAQAAMRKSCPVMMTGQIEAPGYLLMQTLRLKAGKPEV